MMSGIHELNANNKQYTQRNTLLIMLTHKTRMERTMTHKKNALTSDKHNGDQASRRLPQESLTWGS